MKCYKNLFNIKNLKSSLGSFILFPIILIHIVCLIIACAKCNKDLKDLIEIIIKAKEMFIFFKNDYFKLKKIMNNNFEKQKNNLEKDKIYDMQINLEEKNAYDKNKIKNINSKKIKKKLNKRKRKKINIETNEIREVKNSISNRSIEKALKKDLSSDFNQIHSKIFSLNTENIGEIEKQNYNFDINNPLIMNDSYLKNLFLETSIKYEKLKIILNPKENEINSFPYKIALRLDKRTYFQYYFSLIKSQHPLFFSFCPRNDYNIRIIKIDLFFIDIALNFSINALFFNDSTMHQIYEDRGKFNINYQISQIIYSTLISNLLSTIIKLPALTEENVLDLKHSEINDNLKIRKNNINIVLNIKFILFCIISSILLIILFYYVACFCVIYKNTQIHLIKDSIFSYCLSLLYPFIFYLIPGILRILAINNEDNKREILYKISKILQSI